ncbi:unnamed protein product, partial [Coregonus sp. 'balchen']
MSVWLSIAELRPLLQDDIGRNLPPAPQRVVLKGAGNKLSLLGQTCAVCLEEFKSRDELGVCPCSHAFHKNVCPMCNKPICRLQPDPPQGAEGPPSPMEV